MTGSVVDAAVMFAEHVPAHLVELGAASVEASPVWSPEAASRLVEASPAAEYQQHARRLCLAWAKEPQLPGSAVSAALRAAARAVESCMAASRVSLVWTGPPTRAVGLRSTRAVIETLVSNATTSLVLMSFASYKVDDVADSLSAACDRGVDVALILETRDDSGGDLTVDAAHAFAVLDGRGRFYRWPLEARHAYFAETARLHAKCIVADRARALITSANLTGAGINDNIELGVLIESGPLPARLDDHLRLLIAGGVLEEIL
jgi:phosphatidylserine/phosphatidylglycerophosphate/cardiolipin synthase-like enzyme